MDFIFETVGQIKCQGWDEVECQETDVGVIHKCSDDKWRFYANNCWFNAEDLSQLQEKMAEFNGVNQSKDDKS